MTVTILIVAAVVLFAVAGIAHGADARLRRHGVHALVYRWLTGQGWHGKALTNRGWTRPATRALTATGHAPRRHWLPRLHHAAFRTSVTLAACLSAAGIVVRTSRTAAYLGLTAAGVAAYGACEGWGRVRTWQHHKNYLRPLHIRLSHHVPIPVTADPRSWLEVPQDRSRAVITMPKGIAVPAGQERQAIEAAATSTLGMKGARTAWTMTGPRMKLRLTMPIPCPDLVHLNPVTDEAGRVLVPGVREAIQAAQPDEIILGYAQEQKISSVSFRHDSPHIGLSMDSGKGKTVCLRCVIPQILLRGGIALILDNKRVSHPWARFLENVAYAAAIEDIHDALVWLGEELVRRAEFIEAHTDYDGKLTGSPGPRLAVVIEELNLLSNTLQEYWDERRAGDQALPKEFRENLPQVSPAKRALQKVAYIGRELGVHVFYVGQRLSAASTGGGSRGADVRTNISARLLAGYDEDAWKMLVGKGHPMPPPSKHAGRVQVFVKGGDLTETQIALVTNAEARQMALEGTGRVPGKLHRLTQFRPVTDPHRASVDGGSSSPSPKVVAGVAVVPQAPKNTMTLKDAKEAGLVPATWGNVSTSFRVAKLRAARRGVTVPQKVAKRGNEAVYDAVDLADFLETIRK